MSRVLISPKPVDKNGARVPSVTFSVHEAGAWYTGASGNYSVPDTSQIPAAVEIFTTLNASTAMQSAASNLGGHVDPFYIDRSALQLVVVGVIDGNYHIEPVNDSSIATDVIPQVDSIAELKLYPFSTHSVHLTELGKAGLFTPLLDDQTANIARDPLEGVYVAGANGVTWRRDCNESTLMATWFGAKDDRDVNDNGIVAEAGTDTTPILKAIIDFVTESDSSFLPTTGTVATHGASEVVFTKSLDGTGRYNFRDDVAGRPVIEVAGNKNIVLRSPVVQTVTLEASGSADWFMRYMPGSHGRSIGARDLQIVGAGFDVVGGNRGQHIIIHNVKAIQTREAGLRTIDLTDSRIAANAADFYAEIGETPPTANRNVTQFSINNFEAYQCYRQYHFAATTYSKGEINKSRAYASERTPCLIEDDGYVFNGYEFLGVNVDNYATEAFVQVLPLNGAASDITFTDVRFGSEDTNQGGTVYQPPHANIILGTADKSAYDDSMNVTRFTLNGTTLMQGAGHNNANFERDPVEHGVLINCRSSDLVIEGTTESFGETAVIYEGSAANEQYTVGRCVIDMNQAGSTAVNLFSHGGRGWSNRRDTYKAIGAAQSMNKSMDELTTSSVTKNRVSAVLEANGGLNPFKEPNNHYNIETDGTGNSSIRFNLMQDIEMGKRYCVVCWAKAGTKITDAAGDVIEDSSNRISFELFEIGETGNRILNNEFAYYLDDTWRKITIPLGVLSSEEDKSMRFSAFIPSPEGSVAPLAGENIEIFMPSVFEGDEAPEQPLFNPFLGSNSNLYDHMPGNTSSMVAGVLHIKRDAIPTATGARRHYPLNTILTLPNGAQYRCTASGAPGTWVRTDQAVNASNDFADDVSAGVGGVQIGDLYHTSGAVKVRIA